VFVVTFLCAAEGVQFSAPKINETLLKESLPFSVKTIHVGTWNTKLYTWENPDEVLAHIPKHLDVIAFQEVWDPLVAQRFAHELRRHYPHHFIVPSATPAAGCVSPQAIGLAQMAIQCLMAYGIDTNKMSLATPIPPDCLELVLYGLYTEPQCTACLITTMAKLSSADALQAVGICAAGQGDAFVFGGSAGQLVLSKRPITHVEVQEFQAFLIRRVVIFFKVDGISYSTSHYPFDNFNGLLPLPQVLQPALAAATIAKDVDVAIGDFNSGLLYQPDAYNLFLSSNYDDLLPGEITFCPVSFAGYAPCANEAPCDIDHVFVNKKHHYLFQSAHLFNNEVPYSDHIGVKAFAFAIYQKHQ